MDQSEPEDTFHLPLDILPEEVWRIVFGHLNNRDLTTASNVSHHWSNLLEKDRIYFLFPQVFEILWKQGCINPPRVTFILPPPPDIPWCPNQPAQPELSVLDLRLVCKSWNRHILNHLRSFSIQSQLRSLEEDNPSMERRQVGRYRFKSGSEIKHFLEQYQSTHCSSDDNPIVTGWVVIDDDNCRPNDQNPRGIEGREFWNDARALFEKHGKHIYSLDIKLGAAIDMTPEICRELLQQWLPFTRNVVVLNLSFHGSPQLVNAENEVILNGFPKLEHLQLLKTENMPHLIVNYLLQRNSHLRKLKIKNGEYGYNIKYSKLFQDIKTLDNLEEFYINLRAGDDLTDLEATIIGEGAPMWPVKSLYIYFTSRREHPCDGMKNKPFWMYEWPQWNRCFRLMEKKFGETLENLMIRLPVAEKPEDKLFVRNGNSNLRLNLPRLKKLHIELPNLTNIDFLMGVKETLEDLTVVIKYTETFSQAELDREVIKFNNGMFNNMMESNIWAEFPKLKNLHIKTLMSDFSFDRCSVVNLKYTTKLTLLSIIHA